MVASLRPRDFNGAAAALVTLASVTGDKQLIDGALRLQKAASSATQIYQTVALLAAAGTGVGVVMAASGVLGSVANLGGAGTENQAVMGQLSEMFNEMKKQFEIVNAKLDKIIQAIDRMEGKIDQIQASLDEVLVTVYGITSKLDGLITQIQDNRFKDTMLNLRISIQACIGRMKGNDYERIHFNECLQQFIFFGQQASSVGLVYAATSADYEKLLSSFADLPDADAVVSSRYGNVAAFAIARALKEPAVLGIANYAVLWESSSLISILLQQRPLWAPQPGTDFHSDLTGLTKTALQTETRIRDLVGRAPAEQKTRALKILSEGYKKALDRTFTVLMQIRENAITEYIAEARRISKNETRKWRSIHFDPVTDQVWRVAKCADFLNSNGSPGSFHPITADKYKSWGDAALVNGRFLWPERGKSPIDSGLYVCVSSEKVTPDGWGNGKLEGTFQIYLDDTLLDEFWLLWEGGLSCTNTVDCLNDRKEYFDYEPFRQLLYKSIGESLTTRQNLEAVDDYMRTTVRSGDREEIRLSFAAFFKEYLGKPENFAPLDTALTSLNAMVGAMKAYFMLGLPGIWARDDAIRMLLDGRPEVSIVSKGTYFTMLECLTPRVCSNKDMLKLYETNSESQPFWWTGSTRDGWAAGTSLKNWNPLERFALIATSRMKLFEEALMRAKWEEAEQAHHPLLFSSIARLSSYAPIDTAAVDAGFSTKQ